MSTILQFGKLQIEVEHYPTSKEHEEYPGEMQVSVCPLGGGMLDGWALRQYNLRGDPMDVALHSEDAWHRENLYKDDHEPEEDEPFVCNGADELIAALVVWRHLGEDEGAEGTITLNISSASFFWFFHDLTHASHEFYVDETGRPMVYSPGQLLGSDEDRAHFEGARRAWKEGNVPLAEIVEEIVAAQPIFEERFGYGSAGLESFLLSFEADVRADERALVEAEKLQEVYLP